MSFFKSIAAPLVTVGAICGVIAASAPSAEAYEYRSGTIAGYRAEILDSGSYDQADYIEVYGPNGKEEVYVLCAPFDWRSKGPNTVAFANHIASTWCFGS